MPHVGPRNEQRRIWHEIGRSNPCRVEVTIFSMAGKRVRNYFSGILGGGIYNWYWNALDDSGRFVPPGEYRAVLFDCQKQFLQHLEIAYAPDERDLIVPDTFLSLARGIPIRVVADSLRLNVSLRAVDNEFTYQQLPDTQLAKGDHLIPIRAETLRPRNRVRLIVRTKRIEQTVEMLVVP